MTARPLLEGRCADRARETALTYSRALLARRRWRSPSLADGAAGAAVVHAGLEEVFPGRGHARRGQLALSAAICALREGTADPSLGSGVAGVVWAAELLCGRDEDDDDSDLDDALIRMVNDTPRGGACDLLAGLSGLGVCALERLPRPSAARVLAAVVDALDESADRFADGVAWRTAPGFTIRGPASVEWGLGAAHGTPGVIAVLARTCASGADSATKAKARRVLDGAVAWLLAQELPADAGGGFAVACGAGLPRERARNAWCYGDVGVAAALLVAARCTGEVEWERAATRIALAAAARDESDSGARDAGLCHGAAGLGHLYHRLFCATGDERYARAARAWLGRVVAMSDPAAPFTWWERAGQRRVSRPGFLTGGGGAALALLAATGDASAGWDRALCASSLEGAGCERGRAGR
jgi:hypothetical protein